MSVPPASIGANAHILGVRSICSNLGMTTSWAMIVGDAVEGALATIGVSRLALDEVRLTIAATRDFRPAGLIDG